VSKYLSKHGSKKSSTRPTNGKKSDSLASQAYDAEPADIDFEEQSSIEGTRFQDVITILYGPPKIGKSTTMSKFPGVYFLPTEPGYKVLDVRKTYIPNWITFIEFVKKMEKSPKLIATVKVWAVDTADNLAKFCMLYTCGRSGTSHPSDEEWGKGWEAFGDEFAHWVGRLVSLGPGITFVCHEQDREVISRSMKITKSTPSIPKTCYHFINNLSDIILHMTYVKKVDRQKLDLEPGVTRCVFTKPTEDQDAGDRTHRLPSVIPFKTEQELVDKIIRAFRKGD